MLVAEANERSGVLDVGRKPKKQTEAPAPADDGGKSYSFRAPASLKDDIEFVAEGLNLDASNLIRMILTENIRPYIQRVKELKEGE